MEKYGTYYLFKHRETGEIQKVSVEDKEKWDQLEKLAEDNKWVMIDEAGNEI